MVLQIETIDSVSNTNGDNRDWINWIIHESNYLKILQRSDELDIYESNVKHKANRCCLCTNKKTKKQMNNTFYFLSFF